MIALKKVATAGFVCRAVIATAASAPAAQRNGLAFLPGETEPHERTLTKSGDSFKLDADPPAGKVARSISVGKIQ